MPRVQNPTSLTDDDGLRGSGTKSPNFYSIAYGVMAGILVAVAVYSGARILILQRENYLTLTLDEELHLLQVLGRPAHEFSANLHPGDRIVTINGDAVENARQFWPLARHAGEDAIYLRLAGEREPKSVMEAVWGTLQERPILKAGPDRKIIKDPILRQARLEELAGRQIAQIDGRPFHDGDDPKDMADPKSAFVRYSLEGIEGRGPQIELWLYQVDRRIPWVLFMTGIFSGGMGLRAYRLKPNRRSSWGFLIFCVAIGSFHLLRSIPASHRTSVETHLMDYAMSILIIPSIYFLGTFTPLRLALPRTRIYLSVAVGHSALLFVMVMLGWLKPFFLVWSLTILLMLVLSQLSDVWLRLMGRRLGAVDRQRGIIVRWAMLLAFAPMALYVILRIAGKMDYRQQIWFEFSPLVFPVLISYAIVRHNLMQVNEILIEGLVFGALTSLAGGAYLLLTGAIGPYIDHFLPGSSVGITGLFIGGVAFGALPLYSAVRSSLERRFDRSKGKYEHFIESIEQVAATAASPGVLCEFAVSKLRRLTGAPKISIFEFTETGNRVSVLASSESNALGLLEESDLVNLARDLIARSGEISREDLFDALAEGDKGARLLGLMDKLEAVWILPLVVEGHFLGLLALGPKADMRNYSITELGHLRQAARELGLGVNAFRVREQMRQKQLALVEQEKKFELFAQNAKDVIYRYRRLPAPAGFDYISPSVKEVTGYAPEEFYARPDLLDSIVHPEDAWKVPKIGEGAGSAGAVSQLRWIRKDRNAVWVEQRLVSVFGPHGEWVATEGLVRDVTERVRAEKEKAILEAQLRQSQKLEAVGTFAGGIAHDFNNLLTAISGFITIAKATLPSDHPSSEALDRVEDAAQHARGITRSLLTFTRKMKTEKTTMDLVHVTQDCLRVLRRLLPVSIELIEEVPDGEAVWINADETQIYQVLFNLAINARDAMPDGGRLRIGVSSEVRFDSRSGATGGQDALLTVADTGMGMNDDVQSRIFEPFFTTKPREEGTGLGLAIVHGIVMDHGGSIEVESCPGKGTQLTIHLPMCAAGEIEEIKTAQINQRSASGEWIALAEDNEFVRTALSCRLSDVGFNVAEAGDGIEFLRLMEENSKRIRLALLDLDLPKMDGLSCLRRVSAMGQSVPIILMSGNPEFDERVSQLPPRVCFVRKPFSMDEMIDLIFHRLAEEGFGEGAGESKLTGN